MSRFFAQTGRVLISVRDYINGPNVQAVTTVVTLGGATMQSASYFRKTFINDKKDIEKTTKHNNSYKP